MRIGIRSKLILAISLLMVVVFAIASSLFINEKKKEFAMDIYQNVLAFSRLTASNVVYNYDLYLKQNSFVYFNREISGIFKQNSNVNLIKVISYSGEILYDSFEDASAKYEGEQREVSADLLQQIQSENISLKTKDNDVLYLKNNQDQKDFFVDESEKPMTDLSEGFLVEYFVVPASEKYSILYGLDYTNLDQRIARMKERIIYLASFGIFLGMILSFVLSKQVTKPVDILVEGANKIAQGDFKSRVEINTHDEMNFLGSAFNKMAEDLGKSVEAKIYQEKVTHELNLATRIQQQLIPKDIPKVEGLDIAASLIPAGAIGGDIYDFLPAGDKKMMMYLGDVTGHGVPAGIISSIANALFFDSALEGEDLKHTLINVNKILKAKTMQTMFMTLCLMTWDIEKKEFLYSSAGHEQIVHYKADGSVLLEPAGGIALGMMPDISAHIKVQSVDLALGDFLVVYSDGIPECWREGKEIYGIERLKQTVAKFGKLESADKIKDAILADVKAFANGFEQMDDITIIVIRRI